MSRDLAQDDASFSGISQRGGVTGLFKQLHSNTGKLQRLEDEARLKAAVANENFKMQLQKTNTTRNEYQKIHLLRLLQMLKETNDECDAGLQKLLLQYCRELENSIVNEGVLLSPVKQSSAGIASIVEQIDNKLDFQMYIGKFITLKNNEAIKLSKLPKNSFGVPLSNLCERDSVTVPTVVQTCIKMIEHLGGLHSLGLYRVSGTFSSIQKLRSNLDQ
ncbi:hypothetical protein HK096_001835, partial [Nowakowskiella sp. JEL0078]